MWDAVDWHIEQIVSNLGEARAICESIQRVFAQDFGMVVRFNGSELYTQYEIIDKTSIISEINSAIDNITAEHKAVDFVNNRTVN